VGWSDLFTFGEPRTDEAHDLKAFAFDVVGGAPGSMILETASGINDIFSGELAKGLEKVAFLKFASNSIKAYRQMTEGKKTAAGYEAMEPYGLTEAFIRGFGFTPAREAETNERRSYFYGAQKRQSAQRNDLMHQWIEATPAERVKLWGAIERWNKGRPKDERLTRVDLDSYVKRRKTEDTKGMVRSGFRVTRRERSLYEQTERTYNLQ
jgi:hypothetical protein